MHIGLGGWSRGAADPDPTCFLDLVRRADALGFDSIWLSEHHFRREGLPYPAPLLQAAAKFAQAERVRVGLGVVLPAIHHPLLLAEQLAQLDVQSGGRLDVGLGRSNQPEVPAALGIEMAEQPARIRAAIEILVRAWTEGVVSSDDPFRRFDEIEVGPPRQAIVAAPDRCVEQIGRLVAETGIGHLRCVFNSNGTLDRERTLAGMDLFAREALPACRHILPPAADSGAATR